MILLNPNQPQRPQASAAAGTTSSESSSSTSSPAPATVSQSPTVPLSTDAVSPASRSASPKPTNSPSAPPVFAGSALLRSPDITPSPSIKLINEQMQITPDGLSRILSDDPASEFNVIGVIGRQSVGKSTVLNAIAGYTAVKTREQVRRKLNIEGVSDASVFAAQGQEIEEPVQSCNRNYDVACATPNARR